ncbi:MAG TPA: hypothetical protein VJV79_29545 [Polyangiaceae bacterium]|nr:hypothetical protein [Polyangiaceae bacterium]
MRAARAPVPALVALAALVLPLALTLACAETVHGPLPGASDAWARAPEPTLASSVSAPPAAWEGYGEVLRSPAVTPAPFTSRGHPLARQVEVRVNDLARASYTALVTDTVFADGSLLAEISPSASSNGYVMRKSAGVWSYFELDPQGMALESGALALCAGCHAQASGDRVFGLPRVP